MDKWQRTAAYEIPNKPQRIRGLAGSENHSFSIKGSLFTFQRSNS